MIWEPYKCVPRSIWILNLLNNYNLWRSSKIYKNLCIKKSKENYLKIYIYRFYSKNLKKIDLRAVRVVSHLPSELLQLVKIYKKKTISNQPLQIFSAFNKVQFTFEAIRSFTYFSAFNKFYIWGHREWRSCDGKTLQFDESLVFNWKSILFFLFPFCHKKYTSSKW